MSMRGKTGNYEEEERKQENMSRSEKKTGNYEEEGRKQKHMSRREKNRKVEMLSYEGRFRK